MQINEGDESQDEEKGEHEHNNLSLEKEDVIENEEKPGEGTIDSDMSDSQSKILSSADELHNLVASRKTAGQAKRTHSRLSAGIHHTDDLYGRINAHD